MKKMRKRLGFAVVLVVLLIAAGNMLGLANDVCDNYYPDSTYTNAVGYSQRYCDGTYEYGAPFTNYRYHEVFWCGSTQYSAHCQYFDGTGWVTTDCPDQTATALSRIHIPIG